MEEHSIQSIFYKEIRLNDFIVLLKFYPGGCVNGSFTVTSNQVQTVYELHNGIYLQNESKIIFSFSVEWWMTKRNSAYTFFHGFFLEGQNTSEYNVDWLMVINSATETANYSKKGEFSCVKNYTSFKHDPVPSANIEIVKLLT
jgi:hypothetical protein